MGGSTSRTIIWVRNMYIKEQVHELMGQHVRRGSKSARREELQKLLRFVEWLVQTRSGVSAVDNIGRRHVYEFYEYLLLDGRSETTIYKYYLAISKLWTAMERRGRVPKPADIELNRMMRSTTQKKDNF